MSYTKEQIEDAVKVKGYKWFEDESNKGYDVNIVGVRNTSPAVYKKVTNVFDDHLTIKALRVLIRCATVVSVASPSR